jgi:DNA polymerase I-like protein with 3'-5' exonuclease and polymerase domains
LPSLKGVKRLCLDVETRDPNLKTTGPSVRTGGNLVGVGVGIEGGPSLYLPFGHPEDNLPKDAVLSYLKHELKTYDGEIVGANLAYDLDWLWAAGIDMPSVKRFLDVLIAEPLIDDNRFSYSLDSVAKTWVGDQKDKQLMLEAARNYGMKSDRELGAYIHLLPARYVGLYGEQDVNLPLKVLRFQEDEIERQGIQNVWELESKLLPALVRMRQRGVRVDEERLLEVEIKCQEKRREFSDFITRETGVAVGPDEALKRSAVLPALRAAGHQIDADDSLDQEFIKARKDDCQIVNALGNLRKWTTLKTLSIDPVKKHLVNGRIHCTFNQLAADKDDGKGSKGARYGRLSCEHVNMQQQPSRDEEIGPLWRSIYIPEEGKQWAVLDYSQQEPRMLVHWAELVHGMKLPKFPMTGAIDAAEAYRQNPDTDNHEMMAQLAGVTRKQAKEIFLGLCYGMGQPKLCRTLGLNTKVITLKRGPRKGQRIVVAGDDGEKLFNKFHEKVPFLKQMELLCIERATQRGYITTLSGRRCRFPKDADGLNYKWTHRALNRLIQGSAADQTKAALVAGDEAGFPLQLQVHDELDLSIEHRQEAEQLAEIMRNCVELKVPSKVDIEIGPSWGEVK